MGQSLEFACIDCKKAYYVGSGRPKEWDSYKALVEEHKGHKTQDLWTDYLQMRGNDLVNDIPYLNESEQEIVIENYTEYTRINLEKTLFGKGVIENLIPMQLNGTSDDELRGYLKVYWDKPKE